MGIVQKLGNLWLRLRPQGYTLRVADLGRMKTVFRAGADRVRRTANRAG